MNPKSILPAGWEVPDRIRRRLGEKVGRQRAMFEDGHLLLVLHQPPKADETHRVGRFFWRAPNGEWRSNDLGAGPGALGRHLDEYAALLDRYDDQQEAAAGAEANFDVLTALAPLHRSARNMHQTLQEARKFCEEDLDIINFRDHAYHIERSADLLYNETKNALDFAVAKRAEEQALASHRMTVSAHRLNVMVAFFFPIATISTIFGMNLLHGLEGENTPTPFFALVIFGLILGGALTYFITRPSQ